LTIHSTFFWEWESALADVIHKICYLMRNRNCYLIMFLGERWIVLFRMLNLANRYVLRFWTYHYAIKWQWILWTSCTRETLRLNPRICNKVTLLSNWAHHKIINWSPVMPYLVLFVHLVSDQNIHWVVRGGSTNFALQMVICKCTPRIWFGTLTFFKIVHLYRHKNDSSAVADRLCGLVVRVPDYRSRGPGSIADATTFSEM
jgi:hypothetical protein